MTRKKIDAYLDLHLDESIAELSELCAQPSVAAQNWGMQECAVLVKKMLEKRGFAVEVMPTEGAPVVYAERAGKSEQTLLVYCHYDVQPAEPLELWDTPPFEPDLRNGRLFARGVSDDKGHITSRLFAIDALLAELGELPCRVKFVVEGEEEISSIHLHEFVEKNAAKLKGDLCVWEFGGVDHRGVPMQYLGLRGICYVELSVETANQDIHSGTGGSIFPNAAWRLVWALASLKDQNERIQLPGYYDDVIPPTKREIELMAQLPDLAEEYQTRYGLKHFLKGIQGGLDLHIAGNYEPTCTICGLTSGYQARGSKTVLPAKASAKIDFRLAPGQTPEKTLVKLRQHLDGLGFDDITIDFLGGEEPAITDPDDPYVKLTVDAANDVYEHPMQIVPMVGGSGPNAIFKKALNVPIVTSGVGDADSRAHAPNESISLDLYLKGAKHFARIMMAMGEVEK